MNQEPAESGVNEKASESTRETLLALADRVEALAGPDREVDYAIFVATADKDRPNYWHPIDAHQFTGSIDAAMTLVPEGCWAEGSLGSHDSARASLEVHAPMTYDPLGSATAATPALALTAASLRARAEALS